MIREKRRKCQNSHKVKWNTERNAISSPMEYFTPLWIVNWPRIFIVQDSTNGDKNKREFLSFKKKVFCFLPFFRIWWELLLCVFLLWMKERIHEEKTEYFDCLLLIAIMAKYEVWYQFNLMIYKEFIIM